MMLLLLLVIVLILVCVAVTYLAYSGLFAKVSIHVGKPPIGSGKFIYKFYQDEYKNAWEPFRMLEKFPLKSGQLCVGVYYDNPETTPKGKTRFAVGIFSPSDIACDELLESMANSGYSSLSFPSITKAMICQFPFRTNFSIMIAVYRVYPKLFAFTQEKKISPHPYLEIYTKDRILFMAALEKQEEFYVNECMESRVS